MAFNLGNLAPLAGLQQGWMGADRERREQEKFKLQQALQALAVQQGQQQQQGMDVAGQALGQIPQQPPMAPLQGGGGVPPPQLGGGGGMPRPQPLGGGLASSLPAPPSQLASAAPFPTQGNAVRDPASTPIAMSGGAIGPGGVYQPTGDKADVMISNGQIAQAHHMLDTDVGQKGVAMIQRGAPAPAIQESTRTAKQAGRELDPQQWGRANLNSLIQAIDKVAPDAPGAVKLIAAGQLSKLLAPDDKMALQMYMQQNKADLQVGLAEFRAQEAEKGRAAADQRAFGLEAMREGAAAGRQDLQVGLAEFRAQEAEKGRAAADQRAFGLEAMREGAAAGRQQTGIDAASQRQQAGFANKAATASRGAFPPDVVDMLSDQALSGDTSWKTNLGRGAQGAENIAAVNARIAEKAKAQGLSQSDLATRNAEYQGLKAGERTLSQRTANIGMRINEAQRFAPIALDASDKVDRTQFPLFNKMLEAGMMGTGDENIVRLAVATQSLLNAYAAAVTPTGTPTEGAQSRAHELLDKAWSQGQFKTAINQLLVEMDAASKSPGTVREEFRKGAAAPGAGGQPVTGPTSGGISGSPYPSATGVWEAYQAGKLPREQAMKILEDQFGVKAQ